MKIVYTITGMYNSGGMERVLANKANYLSHAKGVDGKSNKVMIDREAFEKWVVEQGHIQ